MVKDVFDRTIIIVFGTLVHPTVGTIAFVRNKYRQSEIHGTMTIGGGHNPMEPPLEHGLGAVGRQPQRWRAGFADNKWHTYQTLTDSGGAWLSPQPLIPHPSVA